MVKKAPRRNAFYCYMLDYKRREEARGVRFNGMAEVSKAAGESWKLCTQEIKDDYKKKADEYNKSEERSQGQSGYYGNKKKKKAQPAPPNRALTLKEAKQRREKQFIQNLVEAMTINDLLDCFFYLAHVNVFCKTEDDEFVPAEIAISRFSLREGVTDVFHRILHPGVTPLGYSYTIKEHSEKTHRIPLDFVKATKGYLGIYKGITDFMQLRGTPEQMPILYTMFDEPFHNCSMSAVKYSLKRIWETSNVEDDDDEDGDVPEDEPYEKVFKVMSLPILFFHLKNKCASVLDVNAVAFDNTSEANIELLNDKYEFNEDMACQFHIDIDNVRYCSQSYVVRWAQVIREQCLKNLESDDEEDPQVAVTEEVDKLKLERDLELKNEKTEDNRALKSERDIKKEKDYGSSSHRREIKDEFPKREKDDRSVKRERDDREIKKERDEHRRSTEDLRIKKERDGRSSEDSRVKKEREDRYRDYEDSRRRRDRDDYHRYEDSRYKKERDRGYSDERTKRERDRGYDGDRMKKERDRGYDDERIKRERDRGYDDARIKKEKDRGYDSRIKKEKDRGYDDDRMKKEKDRGYDDDRMKKEKDRGYDDERIKKERDRGYDDVRIKKERDRGYEDVRTKKEREDRHRSSETDSYSRVKSEKPDPDYDLILKPEHIDILDVKIERPDVGDSKKYSEISPGPSSSKEAARSDSKVKLEHLNVKIERPGVEIIDLDCDSQSNDSKVKLEHLKMKLEHLKMKIERPNVEIIDLDCDSLLKPEHLDIPLDIKPERVDSRDSQVPGPSKSRGFESTSVSAAPRPIVEPNPSATQIKKEPQRRYESTPAPEASRPIEQNPSTTQIKKESQRRPESTPAPETSRPIEERTESTTQIKKEPQQYRHPDFPLPIPIKEEFPTRSEASLNTAQTSSTTRLPPTQLKRELQNTLKNEISSELDLPTEHLKTELELPPRTEAPRNDASTLPPRSEAASRPEAPRTEASTPSSLPTAPIKRERDPPSVTEPSRNNAAPSETRLIKEEKSDFPLPIPIKEEFPETSTRTKRSQNNATTSKEPDTATTAIKKERDPDFPLPIPIKEEFPAPPAPSSSDSRPAEKPNRVPPAEDLDDFPLPKKIKIEEPIKTEPPEPDSDSESVRVKREPSDSCDVKHEEIDIDDDDVMPQFSKPSISVERMEYATTTTITETLVVKKKRVYESESDCEIKKE